MRITLAVTSAMLWTWCAAYAQAPAPPAAGQGTQAAPQRGAGTRGRGAAPEPRVVTFEARPNSIKPGESVVLVWSTENPAGLTIEPGIGSATPRGSKQLKPAATTTYTLTIRRPDNTSLTRSVTVTVAGTTPIAPASADQAAAKKGIPRMSDGKPDFSGVYGFGGGGGRGAAAAAGTPNTGVARTPTLKPGAEQYRVTRGALDTGRTADCMPLIAPDSFGVPYQFQVIQSKDYLVIFHEYPGVFRIIPLDGEPHQIDPDPTWLGDSVGRWEGDTLVVDTIGFNDKTTVSGYRHTDALHTVERFRRTEEAVEYEITLEDPNVFAGPWTETRTFRPNVPPLKKIMEFVCENNRDYRPLFGAQTPAIPNR
jgi:hypothetical protein